MKFLYITNLSGKRINRIWISALTAASQLGYEVHLACNMDEIEQPEWESDCNRYGIISHHIPFRRNPVNVDNLLAYKELSKLLNNIQFDIVHCNTPVGGVLGRICAHRAGVKCIIYQAHGFHFYNGAPLKNWILYYPVERFLAHYTDVLITINSEDYRRARTFKAKKICYVPGVGIDLKKFNTHYISRCEIRHELQLRASDFVLLSVGELIPRKNHSLVIHALSLIKEEPFFNDLQYLICGAGALENELKNLAEKLSVADKVHFLGFRSDIADICASSDLFIFPSLQEGLPVALMEAISSRLPIICSDIRGNTDLIENGVSGCVIKNDAAQLADAIHQMYDDGNLRERYAVAACERIQSYDLESVGEQMRDIYTDRTTPGGYEASLETVFRRQALRREYGIPLDAFVLLSVGEVNYNKNHRLVIEALAQIDNSSIYYLICGQGPMMEEIRERARILGVADRVILAGFCENIVNMYGIADVFVFPSLREGLPVALMEAMASGLPVICSKVRGNVDLVEDGVNGIIVINNVNAMAKSIVALYQTPQERWLMALASIERLQRFSNENVIRQMCRIYSEVI